ncbi:MAG TPA: CBS domain-containing protein [Candidatus Binatia bacterium]|nr:CBS domain-containing protein [Candidatus Binatia bacterium]
MDHKGMVVTAFVGGSTPREGEGSAADHDLQKGRVVREVMTSPVITVPPNAPVKAVAEVLLSNRISAVPVVGSDGRVLGVVSEADLLIKELAMGSGAHLPWFEGSHAHEIRRRREALTAEGLMSAPAISVHPDTPLRQAARTMCEKGINRVLVMAGGWLVGMVSRADVLRIYLLADEQLRRQAERLLSGTLGSGAAGIEVTVREGVAVVAGAVATHSDAGLVERLLARLEGVVAVENHLSWRFDDKLDAEIRRAAHL